MTYAFRGGDALEELDEKFRLLDYDHDEFDHLEPLKCAEDAKRAAHSDRRAHGRDVVPLLLDNLGSLYGGGE